MLPRMSWLFRVRRGSSRAAPEFVRGIAERNGRVFARSRDALASDPILTSLPNKFHRRRGSRIGRETVVAGSVFENVAVILTFLARFQETVVQPAEADAGLRPRAAAGRGAADRGSA